MKQPIILLEGKYTIKELNKLKKSFPIWKQYDIYEAQIAELFDITHPEQLQEADYHYKQTNFINEHIPTEKNLKGNWIYFPWNGNLVHIINEEEYFLLRTNRNRNLITIEEQQKLYDSCIGIIGLSVGSSLATGLSYQGIARNLKLAEFDNLETSNLNRIRAAIHQIGLSKIDIVAQQIYEINPYAHIDYFPKGLSQKDIDEFITKEPKPRVIFEIIDGFKMKIYLRMAARAAGIPVITPANLGDSILFDIERYDIDKHLPLFNGLLGDFPEEILNSPDEDKNKYAVQMVGIENVPTRAMESVKEINKTLVGRPQLSSTVTISGAVGAYLARKVILKQNLPSGRIKLSLDEIFKV